MENQKANFVTKSLPRIQ